MRPDRQRRGARHGRGRKAGQAPERIPAPIQRAAALFLYLARPGAGVPPFPDFRAELEKVTLAIGKTAHLFGLMWGGSPVRRGCRSNSFD